MLCNPDSQGFCSRCGKLLPFAGLPAKCGRLHPHGIGSHLKIVLRKVGIKGIAGCNCSQNARKINKWNADEAEARIEQIVEMMKGEASVRGIPFSRTLAALVVRRAISNHRAEARRMDARKESQRAEATT